MFLQEGQGGRDLNECSPLNMTSAQVNLDVNVDLTRFCTQYSIAFGFSLANTTRVNVRYRRLIVMTRVACSNKTPSLDKVENILPCLPCKLQEGLKTDVLSAT